jgi:hypothetical protein
VMVIPRVNGIYRVILRRSEIRSERQSHENTIYNLHCD